MTQPSASSFALAALLAVAALPAQAGNRSIRVDGFGDWDEFAIGSAGCPGTSAGSTLLLAFGYTFSGRNYASFLTDDYCQVPHAGALSQTNYYYADEAALASLFGDGSGMSGVRYSFFDRPRFDFQNPPTGFQWTVFNFPTGISIVGLYGLQNVTLDSASYITPGVWTGAGAIYDGRYFCFRGTSYLGSWNGTLGDTGSPCLKAADRLFRSGFEP